MLWFKTKHIKNVAILYETLQYHSKVAALLVLAKMILSNIAPSLATLYIDRELLQALGIISQMIDELTIKIFWKYLML